MTESLTPQEIQALKKEILSSMHCALPGINESFDADTQTASVWPPGKRILVKRKDGSLEGLVPERSVEADNLEGKWESELLV